MFVLMAIIITMYYNLAFLSRGHPESGLPLQESLLYESSLDH